MSGYSAVFDGLGLREWCDADKKPSLLSLRSLKGEEANWYDVKFPSLDNLHEACAKIPQTRDFTAGLEEGFLAVRPALRFVLDPLTQPLSWLLESTLYLFTSTPWWLLVPLLFALCYWAARSVQVVGLVAVCFAFFLFTDHYSYAVQTLAIIFVCTLICVLLGVPLGIMMSKSDRTQRIMTPILDMLQTLPTFVYLIPLIFLFKITEPKLYGMAIIMYAIVPVVRLTNLGIRLVDQSVIEAANAYGMTSRQKLLGVEIPLALPNIMAGVNQTIMMSLAMVVIASLVSAPGLGTLVLDGINNLRLGVGFVAGFAIVLLAIVLDRVSKTALNRVNASQAPNS
ncbi:ABC transporter permease subunit [Litorivicinus lipolyticus]|uniref:ABC transporter permease subunit n=1 Tax=Litorivicinus lipolyticus TaxID=418701 RepID=A0A5Q2QHB4_9GAMM|nr:ABC transporter permease subunit [Litorivicinus lipolyticus]QGG80415.1 ABC transporter permease subunit [Litorivicinus lipolyticus]